MTERQELLNLTDPEPEKPSCWEMLKAVLHLLCCPPLPSRITAKLAFAPPRPAGYFFQGDGKLTMILTTTREATSFNPKCNATPLIYQSTKGVCISCLHLEHDDARFTILFSHGNAVDLGYMAPLLASLAEDLKCSIFAYDYPGYGLSPGQPLENGLYKAVEAAWECLKTQFGTPASNIILYGQSIGSAPTVYLASKIGSSKKKPNKVNRTESQLAGVILHSPLCSGLRVLRPQCTVSLWCDPFPNIDKVQDVVAPTLIIHGTEDDLIPVGHSYELHSKCINPVEPLFLEAAGHNDIEQYAAYKIRLMDFLNEVATV
eukprot:m.30969 g.30969  ORF g.30969 m.30969 type:complete len:317 (+) comp8263_c0_seq1:118-1068(+)